MSVLLLFIDGIGLGEETPYNPFADRKLDAFEKLTGGQGLTTRALPVRKKNLFFGPVDANLGMPGLPQSGTGQASLFSGVNASAEAGRHFGPWPHSKTRHLLQNSSLFHRLLGHGFQPHFINAYPDLFFREMERSGRWTCSTLMAVSSGQKLNGIRELQRGTSVSSCLVQGSWRETCGHDIDPVPEEEAARRAVQACGRYDLVMHEYYLTDKAGHSRCRERGKTILESLNRFIRHILEIKPPDDHLVICSDHGNLEDLSVKSHTRNPVPLIIQGPRAGELEAESILDLTELMVRLCYLSRTDRMREKISPIVPMPFTSKTRSRSA